MFLNYDAQGGDGTSGVVAVYEAGGKQIRVPANPADKTAERAAAITALNAALAGATLQQYAVSFIANRATILNAYRTFHESFRTASATPTIGEYRTLLGSTLSILLTLPNSFIGELSREQVGLGLPNGPASGWTLAQCQGWHTLLSGWLGRAVAGVAVAMIEGLD